VQFVIDLADRIAPELAATVMRVSSRFENLVVSNVPGPPAPLYLLGCRAEALHPLMMLMPNSALGITVFSYASQMHWSVSADWDAVPDLDPLAAALLREIARFGPETATVGAGRAP
jgi:hypothetical protein